MCALNKVKGMGLIMENKIIKVIYFDESSAMDYICIVDGGSVATQTSTSNESEVKGKLSIGAKIAASLNFLNLFNAESNVETSAELVNQSKDVVKSTITNTILTDFINKANQDKSMIVKFPNPKITILKETFTRSPASIKLISACSHVSVFVCTKYLPLLSILKPN